MIMEEEPILGPKEEEVSRAIAMLVAKKKRQVAKQQAESARLVKHRARRNRKNQIAAMSRRKNRASR
jgi:hypothetical protein